MRACTLAVAAALLTSSAATAQVCGRGLSDVTVSGTQVLNTFHPAPPAVTTTVLAGATSIPVAAARAGGGTAIATGDLVVVIQMQGAEINRREENITNGTYGDGAMGADRRGVIANVNFRSGVYEYARAAGPVTAGSLPLMGGVTNVYVSTDAITGGGGPDTGTAVYRYQVVKVIEVRDLTVPTGATLTSLPWNGASGGLVAVDAARDMVVNGSIDVTGMGFRGGSPIIPAGVPGTETDTTQACVKGEGFAGRPTRLYSRLAGVVTGASGIFGSQAERGGPGNAGGCPVASDSGGGGGGGGRPGGIGSVGPSMNVDPNIPRPGEGYALLTRLLMGGGGGSGSLDDPAVVGAVSGQAGGGIVLLRATNLSGTGGVIQADGDSGGTQPQEGGGGGGGGGGIFVFTNSTSFAGIALNSRGGNGGTTQTTQDGGGGGGGGGFVLVATPTGMATVTVNVGGGLGGTSPTQNGGAGTGGFQQINIPPLGTPPCPVQCTLNVHCDDGNACTTDTCLVGGTCSNAPVAAGQAGSCAGALVCSGPPTNACVQCVTNAQCSAPTPICDTANVCRAAPVVNTPANGSVTNNPRPPITGTAEANSTVTVLVDGMSIGTTTATALGTFSFTPTADIAPGAHTVSVTAGSPALPSNTNNFTIDVTAPVAPVVQTPANGSFTNNQRPPITGTAEAGSTVTVSIDGMVVGTTTATVGGTFSFTPPSNLAAGPHSVNVTATDAAGNVSPVSNTNNFTVDLTAPAAPVVQSPANGSSTNNQRPPITGTAEAGSTVTVSIDGMVVGTTTANAGGMFTFAPPANLSAGPHTVNATATDAAGNVSPVSNTNNFTIDLTTPAAPVVSTPADMSTTFNARPPITGTAEANSTVAVSVDGAVLGTTMADAMGNWSFTPSAALANGSHTVNATATDAAGNVSPVSNTNTFLVDTTGPAAPVITSPANASTTSNNRPPVTGTAPAGSTVTVRIDGVIACTATASAAGTFSCTPATALTDGPHVATAVAVVGGTSSPTSAPVSFTVDTTPPLTPAVVGPANGSVTADTTPTVTGTGEPGSTITVRIDGMAVGTTTVRPDGTWTFDVPTALTLASHTVSATAADAAGNTSLPSNTNTFTVVAPGAPVVTTPADNSMVASTTPTLGGTAGPNETVTVRVDGMTVCTATANAAGAFSCVPAMPLSEGRHTVTATTPDGAGGVRTSNTNTFTIDTMAPAAPVVQTPANNSTTANTRPTLSGTAEPFSTVAVTVDGTVVGTTVADANGVWSLVPSMPLSTGMHTVSARATDRAGNTSPVSNTNTFTVSTMASSVALQTPVDGSITRNSRPPLSGTAMANAMVEARVDGNVVCTATADAAGAWSCVPTVAIADGRHVATATLMGTMTTSNANAFTIDAMAPAVPVVTSPADGSFQPPTPLLRGTAEPGARVTVSIDGMPVCVTLADASGNWSCSPAMPLSMGMHTVSATATDPAGNVSQPSAANRFTVDSVAPNGPVLINPANGSSTTNTRPMMSGTAEPNSTVVVSVDGNEVCRTTADAQGAFSCTPAMALAVGMHSARATATDAAGNVSMPSNTNLFTVTNPSGAPTITSPADGTKTKDDTPTFTGTAPPNSTVTVREGSTVICTAMANAMGAWSCTAATPLSEGPHTVTATANVNGTDTPASNPTTVTIDTTPPGVTITSGPDGQTSELKSTFAFTSNEQVTFECSIDDGPFMACSSPTPTELGPGKHSLVVRATDSAGNSATARREWTIVEELLGRFAGGGCSSSGLGLLGLMALVTALRLRRRGAAARPADAAGR